MPDEKHRANTRHPVPQYAKPQGGWCSPSVLGAYFLFLAYNGIFSMVSDGGFGGCEYVGLRASGFRAEGD